MAVTLAAEGRVGAARHCEPAGFSESLTNMIRGVQLAALLAASLIASVGCTAGSSTGEGGPSESPGPIVVSREISRSWTLAVGAVVLRPPAVRLPKAVNAATAGYHYTLHDGLVDVEAADPLLWQNTGVTHTKAKWVAAKAGYAQVTVAPALRPKGALGSRTLAFVVAYRIGLTSGCITGWRLYVEPLPTPSQQSGYVGPRYIVETPVASGCVGPHSTTSLIAVPHVSVPWHLIHQRANKSEIRFDAECSPVARVVRMRVGSEEQVQVVVGLTDTSCPPLPPQTRVVSSPAGVRLVPGPTGGMPAERIPLRQ